MTLNLKIQPTPVQSRRYRVVPLASPILDLRYRPFGGLLLSLMTHAAIVVGLLFLPISNGVSERRRLLQQAVIVDAKDLERVLLLPTLRAISNEREGEKPAPEKPPAPSQRTDGFSYPGPQEIVSDVEEPTNRIQTVL